MKTGLTFNIIVQVLFNQIGSFKKKLLREKLFWNKISFLLFVLYYKKLKFNVSEYKV